MSHFLSVNVRGLRNKDKRNVFFKWCKDQKADLVFVQETYWTPDIEPVINSEWKGNVFYAHGSNHARGVAVLVRENFDISLTTRSIDHTGRILLLRFTKNFVNYCLINLYAPTEKKNKESFFKKLRKQIDSIQKECNDCNFIIGGDWNSVLDPRKDAKGSNSCYYKTPLSLKTMLKQKGFIDVWRKLHKDKQQFTWRNLNMNIASRLDYWIISKNISGNVVSTDIRPVIRGDHNAISLKLRMSKFKKGPGYWKLNVSHLSEENFKIGIRNIITKCLNSNEKSDVMKWEILKIKCREFAQKYGKGKNKNKIEKVDLERKLAFLESTLDKQNDNTVKEEYVRIQEKLEKLYKYECKGAGIRSRVKWMEDGEKNTNYFLSLEKKNGEKKLITQLKIRDKKKVVTDQQHILREVKRFYEELYRSNGLDPKHVHDYVFSQEIKELSHDEKQKCEGLMNLFECQKAVFSMKRNKAPGMDGLPVEFYQVFWNELGEILVNAFNESFKKGQMSNSQRKGLITLIHKKGNSDELKNWRPVTLLNCDYKIVATVLARRTQTVLASIIMETQVGYIKGRVGGFNVRIVQYIINYMKDKVMEGAMMIVDFTKAFDVIDIVFIMHCLEKLNFGEEFRNWVAVLYKQIESSVIVNGQITEQFDIQRGIRQGCPLSALLFVIAAEFFANKIRNNNNIKGVCFDETEGQFELKILQYADDTTFFVKDCESLETILNELENFGRVAGPKINKEKTALLWIGSIEKRWKLQNTDLIWTDGPVKYLGFSISMDEQVACNVDWDDKMEKMQRLLDNWRKRNLTLFGRVMIIKSLALSQVVHLLMFNQVPPSIITRLNKMFFRFLWKTKAERVRRCDVVRNCKDGGLKMIDIEKKVFSFRLRWLGRLVSDTNDIWKILGNYWFNRFGGLSLILNSDFRVYDVKFMFNESMPLSYVEIIRAWSVVDKRQLQRKLPVEKNILWHNQYIVFNKRPLFYKEWFCSGIVRLEDILTVNGSFKSPEEITYLLKFRNSKRRAIFDYFKLRQAIPKIWFEQMSKERNQEISQLTIPNIKIGTIVRGLQDITSKCFYNNLIQQEGGNTRCCFFWENLTQLNITWKRCFERNLVLVKDNKLREFNFKVLYNLLPVKRNLCKWNMIDEAQCIACQVDEDITHALITCKLNEQFWLYVTWLIQKVFHKRIDIDIDLLIKSSEYDDIDDLINIAFWSIYKMILLRNYKGVDKRESCLRYVFAAELRKRLQVNKIRTGKPLYRLPNELFDFV